MRTIFIVEDDPMYQLILKHLLLKEHRDINISTFNNGQPALVELKKIEAGKNKMPGIILLDINMPVMDGWQFLDGLRDLGVDAIGGTAIYIISSSLDIRDKERALADPRVKGYLYKPVTAEQMNEMLR